MTAPYLNVSAPLPSAGAQLVGKLASGRAGGFITQVASGLNMWTVILTVLLMLVMYDQST